MKPVVALSLGTALTALVVSAVSSSADTTVLVTADKGPSEPSTGLTGGSAMELLDQKSITPPPTARAKIRVNSDCVDAGGTRFKPTDTGYEQCARSAMSKNSPNTTGVGFTIKSGD